mgnify:CR=1 FL=1
MQSFAGKVKNELCRTPVQRLCCARAEAYGVLLYGNTFSPTEVRLITESADFAARLPRLFQRAFGLKFDRLPEEERGKLIFGITDRSKLDRIINQLGYDPRQNLVLHVNFGLLEDECCRTAFLRGSFLAGGSVTDPEKRYHLELDTGHAQASMVTEVYAHILDEERKINAQKFEVAFYANPDMRRVEQELNPPKPEPAPDLNLQSLLAQLQENPELARQLKALLHAG